MISLRRPFPGVYALCENCQELEKEIQSALDRLHISHRTIDPQRNTPNKSTLDLPDSDHPLAWLRNGRFTY